MEAKEKRIELHKKLRNLSPIRRTEENQKTNYDAKEKNQKAKDKNKKETPYKRNISHHHVDLKISKNINEYRHILSSRQPDDSELKWVVKLRTYPNKDKYHKFEELKKQSLTKIYYRDIDDHLKKVKRSQRAELKTAQPNLNDFRHLCNTRMDGTTNFCQFYFESSLRNFFKDGMNSSDKKIEKWKDISDLQKPRLFSSYYPNNKNWCTPVSLNLGRPDRVLKAYETVYDKVTYENREIFRKRMKESENLNQNFLGESVGLPKYNTKYRIANVNDIRHILSGQTNSVSQFESGLRNLENNKTKLKDTLKSC